MLFICSIVTAKRRTSPSSDTDSSKMPRAFIAAALLAAFALRTPEAAILTPVDHLANWLPALQTNNIVESLNFCEHCVCGISHRTKIVNGDITSFDEFSWAVQIKYNNKHHCGGSLITSRHILTAAHCIEEFDQKLFSVHLADNATYRIKSFTVHENYNYYSDDNDVAIIELARPVRLDGAIKTVCLPNKTTFKYSGMTGVAIGWGRLGYNEPISEHLRKVDLPIMSKTECLRSQYPKSRVTDNMFCAGYHEGGRDSCRGDSGGPLHVRNDDDAMEIVGIVSFGEECAKKNYPGVYTKVTNYLEWIGKQLKNECLCSPPQYR
ncbi:trypsin-3-like [Phymastichus coffea]|uniref:trypsin-3-like n=1 Tax=Phymastichus coffea TaxID=108790 RepID=UPI00273ADEA2|nr:trypsin-3-like [Phymastichus coffea]